MSAKGNVSLSLSLQDVHSVLLALRRRQDDCRRIGSQYPTYEIYHKLDMELDVLKHRISSQIGE
jgi:hypothetical protein